MNRFLLFQFIAILFSTSLSCLAQNLYASPQECLDGYLKACAEGDINAADQCLTASSQKLLKTQHQEADPRQPEDLKNFRKKLEPVTFRLEQVNSKRAIYWPSDEGLPPFLLRVQTPEDGWRVDYHFMSSYIRVNDKGWDWRDPKILGIWKKRE